MIILEQHVSGQRRIKKWKLKKEPYGSVLDYIWKVEEDYYDGKHSTQSLESKLTTIYALYNAAWANGEIEWDDMFYSYADFVAKLLHIR